MKKTYIIAEIGQNHNGSVEIGKNLIDLAGMPVFDKLTNTELPKVDAIKLTKRDLSEELSLSEYERPYNTPHAFADTYGKHREALELSYEEHVELINYAKSKGLEVVETLCSPKTVKLVSMAPIDRLKVASRDLTNIPLLEAMAETKIPVILSTGMSGPEEIRNAVEIFAKYHSDISILHCISQYPAKYENLNLNAISTLKKEYGDKYTIGYSDHSMGIMIPVAAVAMGAEIIEKHITLSHVMKGSDHAGSLEMEGLWRMTRDIRNLDNSFGDGVVHLNDEVKPTLRKLRRSLAVNCDVEIGETITEEMLTMLSPGDGLRWEERNRVVGKKVTTSLKARQLLKEEMFCEV